MNKTRLEAFSDGVFAIIITIMVLELKIPKGHELHDLVPLLPVFFSYLQSFLFVGNYWVNHHHLVHTAKKTSSGMMLANLLQLFCLSLVPFGTAWAGESGFAPVPVAIYAVILLLCGFAYNVLQQSIRKTNVWDENMKKVMARGTKKGWISLVAYLAAIPLAFVNPVISEILFVSVSILWLVPDKDIEKAFS